MAGTDYRGAKQGQTVPPGDYASSYQHSSASQVPMPPDAYSAAYQAQGSGANASHQAYGASDYTAEGQSDRALNQSYAVPYRQGYAASEQDLQQQNSRPQGQQQGFAQQGAAQRQGQPSKLRSNGVISKDGVKQVGPHPVGLRATRRQRREVVALWGLMGRHGRALRQLILRNRA